MDTLNENYVNVTSHVISMEIEWPKYKQTNINLAADNVKISAQIDELRNETKKMTNEIYELENKFKQQQKDQLTVRQDDRIEV